MKIIIDFDKKTIEVPKKLKEASDMLGNKSILDSINVNDYKIIVKSTTNNKNRIVDKTNKKTIEDFMNKVKDSKKEIYEEYLKLIEGKISFLKLKQWFYTKFPSENPFKK